VVRVPVDDDVNETPGAYPAPLIVGIGASAGGLSAFRTFLGNIPLKTGMAFVLVQHLSPDHKSMLTEILAREAPLPVIEAENDMMVEPDHVYVIPADSTLQIRNRRLQVDRPAPPRENRRPIDTFFVSLAEDQAENAVCVVLSGTGSDGSSGVMTVKEHGGLALAQAEVDHTAMPGMPQSATNTGLVDYVLPVEAMPAKLLEYQQYLARVADRKDGDGTRTDVAGHLGTITSLLQAKTGHDFGKYKEKTVTRRIQRRMQVLQTETFPAYIDRLRQDPSESELLFRDLLIGVTQFFRDPDAFEALGAAIAKILSGHRRDAPIRVWVAACSTGEEVYSIAILLREAMEQLGISLSVQIFGTDIDDRAIEFARSGRYGKTIGLSAEQRTRWFIEENGEFCPTRQIREMCVFSVHNVIKDPPFSKLDLLSCRNLLIYMDSELQDRILRVFHYALNPGATLFLGPSEGASRHGQLFAAEDKKHHIFIRRDADVSAPAFPIPAPPIGRQPLAGVFDSTSGDRIERKARLALAKYSPVYIVIDAQQNIVRFSGGETGRYLEPSAGAASLGLFGNLRKNLRAIVRTSIQKALATGEPVVNEDVIIQIDGTTRLLTVIVEPIVDDAGVCVVAFREGGTGSRQAAREMSLTEDEAVRARATEHELRTTQVQLQATIDDLETANEEMKSAAEEYQSVNEELQSTNEELETSKEEMQSINEELQTVNAELQSKNALLTHLNSDLKNLLDSTQIATIFLDDQLRIKSFTPGMVEVFSLREGDRGRPLTEIVSLLAYEDLRRDVAKVLRDLTTIERELPLIDHAATFIMRIRPYRSVENIIDGVVITFVDITDRRNAETARQMSETRFSVIFDQTTVGIAEIDLSGRFVVTNARFQDMVGRSADELQHLHKQDITHHEDLARYDALLERLVETGAPFEIEKRYLKRDGSQVWVHDSVSPMRDGEESLRHLIVVSLEIGDRKRAEEQTELLLGELDHRVKNILAIVSSIVSQTLKTSSPAQFANAIEGRIAAIARAHSMLTEHGAQGKTSLREIVLTELAPYDRDDRVVSVDGIDVVLTPRAGLSLALAIHELASNAAKYGALSKESGRLSVTWTVGGDAQVRTLTFVWLETGGPPLAGAPKQQGFGTTLIERSLTYELDATVNREFLTTGLRSIIQIPLTISVGEIRSAGDPQ
jgi:two-component system, chemotaxis family, CheB/CheR fusion protein